MRVALKFGYDGSRFWGYQRQPDVHTVEGDIIAALKRTRMVRGVRESNFQSSSRTDRGASAIGNVLAFDTDFRTNEILQALNSKLGDIYFWGFAEVEDGFNPRYAKQRWYRYHLGTDLDLDTLKEVSPLFVGEHDFKTFCRKSERSTVREVDSIQLKKGKNFIYFDVKGQSFLWNMVRRIVSAIVGYAQGEISEKTISDALSGKATDLGLAPPHPLILMDVSYDFRFDVNASAIPPSFEESYERLLIQEELLSGLRRRIE